MNTLKPSLPAMKGSRYEPKVGDTITVELPDERARATIEGLVSDTAVTARLLNFPVSRSHNYKKGDLIACRLRKSNIGINGWHVVPERELQAAQEPKRKRGK